jgi:hypothetical protein
VSHRLLGQAHRQAGQAELSRHLLGTLGRRQRLLRFASLAEHGSELKVDERRRRQRAGLDGLAARQLERHQQPKCDFVAHWYSELR